VLPLNADYALAVQKRMASAYDLARRHLNKVAVRPKRNYDKQLTGRPSLLVILFGYITFGGRGETWEGPYLEISLLSDVVGAPNPEEPKDQGQGCFFKQIKALTGTPTGETDYKEADAVNELERRAEIDIR